MHAKEVSFLEKKLASLIVNSKLQSSFTGSCVIDFVDTKQQWTIKAGDTPQLLSGKNKADCEIKMFAEDLIAVSESKANLQVLFDKARVKVKGQLNAIIFFTKLLR